MSEVQKQEDQLAIEIRDLNTWYGEFHVLKNINLQVQKGERIVICGPSGSGKSTMIRCINRLEEHQQGEIIVNGVPLVEDVKKIEAIRKDVGMVFQHFNLFPHLTVLENCCLAPIGVQKRPRREAEAEAMKYLERVRIADQAHKFPGQLSGGQQQRVAIARSLCLSPEVMLFDEPTSALDPEMIMYDEPFAGQDPISMGVLLRLIRRLNDALGLTAIVVSHDVKETLGIADYVYVISEGEIVDHGTPDGIRNSESQWVQQFVQAQADGPVPFHYSATGYRQDLLGETHS